MVFIQCLKRNFYVFDENKLRRSHVMGEYKRRRFYVNIPMKPNTKQMIQSDMNYVQRLRVLPQIVKASELDESKKRIKDKHGNIIT